MLGAIFGDIVGSVYEFDNADRMDFELVTRQSRPTDDSCMALAVAAGLMDSWGKDDDAIRKAVVSRMRQVGRAYPYAGYGGRFREWLVSKDPKPYHSYGNGSAMRVAPVGWLYDTMKDTLKAAQLTAEVTHDHPEGIRGAQAVAAAMFLARTGSSKDEIKEYVERTFGYDLSRTLAEIRPEYRFYEICQKSVPEAITAFLEGDNYEDVIRKAVWLGGDSDTIACMAGAIAECYFGMPRAFRDRAINKLDVPLRDMADRFNRFMLEKCGRSAYEWLEFTD